MIDLILAFALRQKALVFLCAVGLLGVGLWSAVHLPIDAVPDLTEVQVQVNTEVPAYAAEESEKLVTQPIEMAVAGLTGVEEMRSLTKFGLSQVTLQFADSTDIYRARQLVTERLQNAQELLPRGVVPKLAPISTGLGEIVYYSLGYRPDAPHRPKTELEQLIALSELQNYVVKPLLRTVPGIAEINETGGYEMQYVVEPKPDALIATNLTFGELAEIVGQNVENAGGGIVNRGGQQLTIRAVSRVQTLDDIGNLPIKFGAGVKPILVKDVATVKMGTRFRTGAATLNGHETIIGTTMMLAGENGREVALRVKARLADIQSKLPAGVEISLLYDRSILIGQTIGTVQRNLIEGALLVIALLFALLGNWRGALIIALSIPLSFLFALTGMRYFGISGNLMSLGAIDFGLIIDGAVVMVENIVRQLGARQHQLGRSLTEEERNAVVLTAGRQVGLPMFVGIVIITVVYVPILALTGIEGKMFHPMALTVMLALAGALLMALTLMPALTAVLLRGSVEEKDYFLLRWAQRAYRPALRFALRQRLVVLLLAFALFGGSMWIFHGLGAEFVPTLDEGSITDSLIKDVGMSVDESLRTDREIETQLLAQFPEISTIYSRIGTSEIASDPMPPNETDMYLTYRPIPSWPRTPGRPTSKAELEAQLETAIKKINAGYTILSAQPIEMHFNEMLEGAKAELVVKIFGPNYDVLEPLAEQAKAILTKTPGASEVEYEVSGRTPQLQINVNREALRRYNFQAGAVNDAVHAALAGDEVGMIIDGNQRHAIAVRMPEQLRADDAEIRKLPVRVGLDGLIPLGKVVDFSTTKAVEPILRDDGQRRAAIMVNLSTHDIEGYVEAAQAAIRQQIKLPPGYLIQFGGQYENLQTARARLAVVVPAALLLIFVLIYLAFGSVRQAILVYSGVPLAVTGGIFALWLRAMPFSITAAVGFIALTGVAVLNGVVLVSYFNQLRAAGRSVDDAVIEGSFTRLRPVLTTALVASLGFVPMALATGAGAEVQRPLATVVIGGVVSSTLLTLVVVPVLYSWSEKFFNRQRSG